MATKKLIGGQSISGPTRVMIPSKKPSAPNSVSGIFRKINASIMRGNHEIVRNNTKSALRKAKK